MSQSNKVIVPTEDGVSHINLYTKGKTRLGRLMTNLADIPVNHPVHGTFRTAEGLWYYLKTGMEHDDLRAVSGFDAKRLGMSLKSVWNDQFEHQFKAGIRLKLANHKELRELLVESTLPFEHYYFYGSEDKPKVVEPKGIQWLTDYWSELRDHGKSMTDEEFVAYLQSGELLALA